MITSTMQTKTLASSILLFLYRLVPVVDSAIGQDGLCPLYTFVHFTNNGSSAASFWGISKSNPGFNHMAAALLAMEHFNARDTSVVTELANFSDCTIKFDLNKSLFFDTESGGHAASEALAEQAEIPCAIAGPYHDLPGLELSAFATAHKFPLVASRAFNLRLSSEEFSPYSSQVYPGMFATAFISVEFLMEKGRTNYINLLYALSDTGIQRREALTLAFDIPHALKYETYAYFSLPDQGEDLLGPRDIFSIMQRMKRNGYRTIVVAMEDPSFELPLIADAAEKLGMNNGDYFWMWFGLFETTDLWERDPNIIKLVAGSAWISPMDFAVFDSLSRFYRSWSSQGPDFVDRVNAMNPIKDVNKPGFAFANSTYFRDVLPELGSGFLYDAVMTIGMGACLAQNKSGNSTSVIDGSAHVDGIWSTNFSGVSGRVIIENGPDTSNARMASTVIYAAFNFLPFSSDEEDPAILNVSDIHIPKFGAADASWFNVTPFIFADGRTVPPDLLRDIPNQNYLSSGLRAFGLALMCVAFFTAILSAVWVFAHRKHAVLRAAQPDFLYVLALGSAVTASAILPLSFDESYGWSADQLSHACMAVPWLASLGQIITYGALFCKLWRVNKVLQFVRRKVDVRHVVWPSIILFVGAIIVLSVWTALDPLKWEREEVNEDTGESIGECKCDHFWAYFAPLIAMLVIATLMAAIMAWKTKDVDDAYSESKWIFIVVLVQIEVIFVATPIVGILHGTSADGRYIGLVVMIWIFPMSTLLFVMIPKVIAYRHAVTMIDDRQAPKRGEKAHGGVRVTGVSTSSDVNRGSHNANKRPSSSVKQQAIASSQDSGVSTSPDGNRTSSEGKSTPSPVGTKLGVTTSRVTHVSTLSDENRNLCKENSNSLRAVTQLDVTPTDVSTFSDENRSSIEENKTALPVVSESTPSGVMGISLSSEGNENVVDSQPTT